MIKRIGLTAVVVLAMIAANSLHAQNDSLISGEGPFKVLVSPNGIQAHYFYESSDGGATWDTVHFSIEGLKPQDHAFLLDFNGPSPILMLTDNHWVLPGFDGTFKYEGEVLVSNNRGRTWKLAELPDQLKSIHRDHLHFSTPQNGVIFEHNVYATTQDSGYTWRVHNYPIKITYHRNRFVWLNDTLGAFSANNNTLYTKDGGQSWLKTVPTEMQPELTPEDALLALGFFRDDILLDTNYTLILVHSIYQQRFDAKNKLVFYEPQDKFEFSNNQKRLTPIHLKHGRTTFQVKEKEELLLTHDLNLRPGKVLVLTIDRDNQGALTVHENEAVAAFCQTFLDQYRENQRR